MPPRKVSSYHRGEYLYPSSSLVRLPFYRGLFRSAFPPSDAAPETLLLPVEDAGGAQIAVSFREWMCAPPFVPPVLLLGRVQPDELSAEDSCVVIRKEGPLWGTYQLTNAPGRLLVRTWDYPSYYMRLEKKRVLSLWRIYATLYDPRLGPECERFRLRDPQTVPTDER